MSGAEHGPWALPWGCWFPCLLERGARGALSARMAVTPLLPYTARETCPHHCCPVPPLHPDRLGQLG